MTSKFTRKDSASSLPAARPKTPNVPIHSGELPFEPWEQGRRFGGRDIPLGDYGGCERIGVTLVELTPKKQSCPMHWHMKEEEHFYVLEGRCILRTGAGRFEMGPRDYVCFPAGTGVAHCFENPFDAPCRLLAVGNRERDEVAVYTESRKVKLRSLGIIVPLPEDRGLDYWQGERADEPLD